MRPSDAAKVARLRGEEIGADEVATPIVDDEFDTLSRIRDLDERIEGKGLTSLLDPTDQRIADEAQKLGRIRRAEIARVLALHPSTVGRRVRRLLHRAPALDRFGKALLGESEPQSWEVLKRMAITYAWSGVGDRPEGALDLDNHQKLSAMYRAGNEAHRLLSPTSTITELERRGGKVLISGPGPLTQFERDLVSSGQAERIFDKPRCHACGRYLAHLPTGRPLKYCDERCRSRSRRR